MTIDAAMPRKPSREAILGGAMGAAPDTLPLYILTGIYRRDAEVREDRSGSHGGFSKCRLLPGLGK